MGAEGARLLCLRSCREVRVAGAERAKESEVGEEVRQIAGGEVGV